MKANVHVTKLAAAQRQLRAAIRMFFSGEDELAVHTVGAAAYRLLADLKTDRGRDEVGDYYLTSIFYCVRDYRRGTLPSYLQNDPEMMRWIQELAEQLPINADSNFEDVKVTVPKSVATDYWQKRNSASNFLKHADRDPNASLSLDEVDNLHLLIQAYGAYVDLLHDDLEGEGFVLRLYYSVKSNAIESLPPHLQDIAKKLEPLEPTKRMHLCSRLIREFNEA